MSKKVKATIKLKSGHAVVALFHPSYIVKSNDLTGAILHTFDLTSGDKLFVQGDSIEYIWLKKEDIDG